MKDRAVRNSSRAALHFEALTANVYYMSIDPRVALQSLISALEEHLAAASSRRGDEDPSVESAYLAIADAFEGYEEALYAAHSEVTPLVIYDDDDDDEDGEEEEDDLEVVQSDADGS